MRSWRSVFSIVAIGTVIGPAWNAVATTPTEFERTATDADTADFFGYSVSIDGDDGSSSGSGYTETMRMTLLK